MGHPTVIDTDAGIDDALAVILALRSPELSVMAITSVAGNARVDRCTRNVRRILGLLGGAKNIVVSAGSAKPLRRALTTAPEVHGRDGLGDLKRPPEPARVPMGPPASLLLADLCDQYPGLLTIVALGPLTNLARAWRSRPRSLMKVRAIVSMGGAFRVPGNTGPVAEFNYFVDPEAADILFTSGLPLRVIPLDVTEQIVLRRREVLSRALRGKTPVSRFIRDVTGHYIDYHRRTEGLDGCFLHDPVAIAAAAHPEWFRWARINARVETSGIWTRGMTVADFRVASRSQESAIRVATGIDAARFFSMFRKRMWI